MIKKDKKNKKKKKERIGSTQIWKKSITATY